MADTLTVRASEEIQSRFKGYAEDGDFRNQGEFLTHLLTLYAAQETSIRVPTLESAISAVNELADRINKVLIGAGETISANQEKEKAQIETLQHEADKKVSSLAIENENLKTVIEEQIRLNENVQRELAETKEHEKKLDQTLNEKTAHLDEYREKINDLETEINRKKIIVSDAKDAMNELDALRLLTKEQDLKIEHTALEKEKALNDQKTFYTEKITATISEYEATVRQKELEIGQTKILNDKALIELETKLRKEMSDQQAQHGKSISEYESRYLSLLKELENLKIRETKK